MKFNLPIHCGQTTCYCPETGLCKFITTTYFGTRYHCGVFNKELRDENGDYSGPGMLQRLNECVETATTKVEESNE
jgi:hypothetical protein